MAATSSSDYSSPGVPEFHLRPGQMTEEQFVAWCRSETRAEWVNGEVVMMTPANVEHCDLAIWLACVLRAFAEEHGLGVVQSEVQIRGGSPPSRRVPDLLFLARDRMSLLRETHVDGMPDLIVEIVSPDSPARDWRDKYLEYEAHGVREYWVLDPGHKIVEVYALQTPAESTEGVPAKAAYRRVDEDQDAIRSTVLAGLVIPKAWLWTPARPKVIEALRSLGLLGEKT